jgi:ribosomal protein L19E
MKMMDEIKRLVDEYNSSGENKIWINYDNIKFITKYIQETQYYKKIIYNVYMDTIRIILEKTHYKEDGKETIDYYVDYLYDISC